MKTKPFKVISLAPGHVHIKIEEATAGDLITSSRESAIEYGEVIMVADDVQWPKVGDKVLFKAWGTDITNYKDTKNHFIDTVSRSIKAVIK